MKKLKCAFSALLLMACTAAVAQKSDSRPAQFAAYPQTLTLQKTVISSAVQSTEGSPVTVAFSPDFQFTGTVISNKRRYDNMQSVIIRSADNTTLQVTEITNKDNSVSYTGRIISNDSADGYEIKNANGNYSLQKFQTARLLQPCNM